MRLVTNIVVKQTAEQVWEFLANPLNAHKWDKSIARVELPPAGFTGQGCVVQTIAPSGMRQSFVVSEFAEPYCFKFRLVKSRMFKDAELIFFISRVGAGAAIRHELTFRLRFYMLFLYPVFLLTNKKALARDISYLKAALAQQYGS
jgi:hypothetical protein